MPEDKNPEPADNEAEDFEVVAHSAVDEEEENAGCIVNNSQALL
jgi:hypothetical protein